MEYGVFFESGANWLVIFFGIALIVFFVFCVLAACVADSTKKQKVSLFGSSRAGYKFDDTTNASYAFSFLAAAAFIAALIFILVGLRACSSDSIEKLTGDGKYKITESYLVFEERALLTQDGSAMITKDKTGINYYSYSPTLEKPLYFELKLEGREKQSHSQDLRIVRAIEIPYDRVIESYKYKSLVEKPTTTVLSKDYNKVHLPIKLPLFIVKKDSLWMFMDDAQ